jgi:hypothetical protein
MNIKPHVCGAFFMRLSAVKFSQKTRSLAESPKFKKDIRLSNHIVITLNRLKMDITLHFGTKKEEEIVISQIFFEADYNGPYLGVIDAYISLIQGKPVEASDRFPIKELDYFLRDQQDEPAFTAYSQEIYEIIAIGEKIKNHVFGKTEVKGFEFDEKDNFVSLSSSEQFEIIEEFLSFNFYKKGVHIDDIECLDIEDLLISFNCKLDYQAELQKELKNQIDRKVSVAFK